MNSTFTWMDYSERDRRHMMQIIDGFREKGTRNDLGLDSVAGAFSEMLFPGITVQQNRARYLLFVPWIYVLLERQGVGPTEVRRRLKGLEVRLIDALQGSDDNRGVIGRRSRENLQRFPSYLFWSGLKRWQILLFPGSQDQYHESLSTLHEKRRKAGARSDDGEALHVGATSTWHPSLPEPPADFPEEASFKMTRSEASFLQERMQTSQPNTLLSFLVSLGEPGDGVPYPWQHSYFEQFPEHIRMQLHHARMFSELAHGATLLYNHMLAEASAVSTEDEHTTDGFADELENWSELIEGSDALACWDRDEFWRVVYSANTRVPASTRAFFDNWCDIVLTPGGAASVAANERARVLIRRCEHSTKGSLARLSNPRRLELWNAPTIVGRHSFGWFTICRLLQDIADGLQGGCDA